MNTKLVLLGTGTPVPEPDRSGPAVAVVVNQDVYLFDAGAGIVRRASGAFEHGIPALDPTNLKRVFFTHLHSDHTVGYPDLILTPWVVGRRTPLEAYGPEGLKSMTDHILLAYQQDYDIRVNGLEKLDPTGHTVNVHEIEPGTVYKDSSVTIEAFAVKHGSWPQAFGYRVQGPDRTIVISGDTAPTQTVIDACDGCDILLHEVYVGSRPHRYMQAFHTSADELAKIANAAKPKLLVLYHQLYLDGKTDEDLLREIRRNYNGAVVSGRDLDDY
ncbi:MAG: MBL fold metallo-hydrolase [Candidatus Sulfotelmatobacter sp.]